MDGRRIRVVLSLVHLHTMNIKLTELKEIHKTLRRIKRELQEEKKR